MNKFFSNIFSFLLAIIVIFGLLFNYKNEILNYYDNSLSSLSKTRSLQNDLENGKIVLFGSSELLSTNQKFIPQNYFNNDLKLPLRIQGNEGHQSFAIMSQLATFNNEQTRKNAKIVILISPSWFTGNSDNGTKIPKFLEFMYPGMMNKLYFQSEVDDSYKILISEYVKKNINLIKEPSFIYTHNFGEYEENFINKEAKKFIIELYDDKYKNLEAISYNNPNLDFENLKKEAKKLVSSSSTNNSYGINNDYFTKFIEPSIKTNSFPYTIIIPEQIDKNQEYQDFLQLLNVLKDYEIKPLFVMQDLHPYVFVNNRENMTKLILDIKSKVQENGYEYFDMWSYKKEDYEIGTLSDIIHLGELGWVKINQKIIEYFIAKKEK